jgi:hypothetical protein
LYTLVDEGLRDRRHHRWITIFLGVLRAHFSMNSAIKGFSLADQNTLTAEAAKNGRRDR